MRSAGIIERLRERREGLLESFATALSVEAGRRACAPLGIASRGRRSGERRGAPSTVAEDAVGPLRGEYLVACWLLCLVGLAIDRRTVAKGRIGVVLDAAIDLSPEELEAFDFKRGRRRDGYSGNYLELSA